MQKALQLISTINVNDHSTTNVQEEDQTRSDAPPPHLSSSPLRSRTRECGHHREVDVVEMNASSST